MVVKSKIKREGKFRKESEGNRLTVKMVKEKVIFILTFLIAEFAFGKIYERCELAKELKDVLKVPAIQIPVWVCIAEHQSKYNTSALGELQPDGTRSHGMFQINDKYWCSPPGRGKSCHQPCSKFEDDSIADDYECLKTIYKEHTRLQGDGFKAWTAYEPHCSNGNIFSYVKDCF